MDSDSDLEEQEDLNYASNQISEDSELKKDNNLVLMKIRTSYVRRSITQRQGLKFSNMQKSVE